MSESYHNADITVMDSALMHPIIAYVESLGIDVKHELSRLGYEHHYENIMGSDLKKVAGFPIRLVLELAKNQGVQHPGYWAAIQYGDRLFPHLQALFSGSESLYQFLTSFCRYSNQHLLHMKFFVLESTHGGIFLRRNEEYAVSVSEDITELHTMTMIVMLIRHYLRKDWTPAILWLTQGKFDSGSLPVFQKTHIFFDKPVSKIFISEEDLGQPDYRSSIVELSLAPIEPSLPIRDGVIMILKNYAFDALPDFNGISRLTGIHSKQLQLKLAAEQTTFRQIVLELRKEQAELLMRKTDFNITRIAIEVGYSKASHMSRALSPLMGMTPLKRLKQLRQQ